MCHYCVMYERKMSHTCHYLKVFTSRCAWLLPSAYVCHYFYECMFCHTHLCVAFSAHTWRIHTCAMTTRVSFRVTKTHRMPLIFIGHFPRKSPAIGGSFAKNHLMSLHVSLTGWWRLIECLLFRWDISRKRALQLVVVLWKVICN